MKVLAIDTSTSMGSVALLVDGVLLGETAASVRGKHGEMILPLLEEVLGRAGVELADVDLIAVGIGPGSFTGVRIGVATAKGLALATGRPIRGVMSLRAIARGLGPVPCAVPVIDAHRGEVFVGAWRGGVGGRCDAMLEPFHAPPEEAAQRLRDALGDEAMVLCGDGLRKYEGALVAALGPGHRVAPPIYDSPRAGLIALEAEEDFGRHGPDDLAALEPLYLRPSDARLPSRPLRLAPLDDEDSGALDSGS